MKIRMQQPVKVIVEHDLSKTILELLKNDGLNKPFIVLDKFLLGVPAVKEMLRSLEENGIEYKTYAEIVPDPPALLMMGQKK